MLNEISGQLIRAKRGTRTLKEVVEASGNAFSDAALCKWEQNKMKPKTKKIQALLQALNCGIEDITVPVDLGLNN